MSMRGKYDYREPLYGEDGLYITAAQMQFFLNRRDGEKLFSSGDPRFMKYYKNCTLYNLVYDMMEEDPDCAKMYWDEKTDSVALAFPMQGEVSKALAQVAIEVDDDDEGQDDPYDIFQ
jgi:hypothetical protein